MADFSTAFDPRMFAGLMGMNPQLPANPSFGGLGARPAAPMPMQAPQMAPQGVQPAARSLGPSVTPNATPAAPQGGQQYLMSGGLGDWARANQSTIANLASGLLSGSRRGLSQAIGSLPQAQQMDRQSAAMADLTKGMDPRTAALARAFPQLYAQQQFAAPPKQPDAYTGYLKAKEEGYAGSWVDYQMMLRKAGASPTTVNVDTAGNKFAGALGQGLADEFLERRAAATEATQSLGSIAEARKLLDSGVITGFGANFKIGLGKALQQAGFNYATDEVANTEAFVAAQAKEVGRIIKLFGAGTGLSDKDREFAQQAAAGNIDMTEESIRRILDINERAARNVIGAYNADAARIPPGMSPYPLTVDLPGGGDAPEGVDPAVWEYMTPQERALWQ